MNSPLRQSSTIAERIQRSPAVIASFRRWVHARLHCRPVAIQRASSCHSRFCFRASSMESGLISVFKIIFQPPANRNPLSATFATFAGRIRRYGPKHYVGMTAELRPRRAPENRQVGRLKNVRWIALRELLRCPESALPCPVSCGEVRSICRLACEEQALAHRFRQSFTVAGAAGQRVAI